MRGGAQNWGLQMINDPKTPLSDSELDSLFAAARSSTDAGAMDIEPSADFLAQVLKDAQALQPGVIAAPRPNSRWVDIREALGGWAGFGGLVAASVTGLMIGVVSPDALTDVSAYWNGDDAYSAGYDGFDLLLEEG